MGSQNSSSRIFINALASYGRMLVSAIAGLFTVPIALHELGSSDYGIFAVIAGTLSFLLFLNVAMNTGAQRHIAYSLGQNNNEEASAWLTISVIVHSCLGTLLLVAGLLLSHLVILHLLRIPALRVGDAFDVYYITIAAVFVDIISTPFRAYLTAREAMVSLSAIGSIGAAILCLGAFSLRVLPGDKLLWYSGFYVFSQVVMVAGPSVYCLARYPQCRNLHLSIVGWKRIRELASFSGWMLFGALSGPVRTQGPAVLLNRFCGSVMNAAYGVAFQVSGFTAGISSGLIRATTPAIVKLEAGGNRQQMLWLSNLTNKYAFMLLWLGVGPLIVDPQHWLNLWLSKPPADTATFLVFLLVALLNDQLTSGFMASVQAHGRIAYYQIAVSMASYLVVPLGYLFLKHGLPPSSATWAVVVGSIAACILRLGFVNRMLGVKVLMWLTRVLLPCATVTGASVLVMRFVVGQMKQSLMELAALEILNALVTVAAAGITSSRLERGYWKAMAQHLASRAGDRFGIAALVRR